MTRYVTCPAPDADLQEVIRFALSHNGYERLGREVEALTLLVEPVLNTVGTAGAAPEWAGIDLLRGALFFLQRQSHHWGDVPPHQEARMRLLVAAIARVYPGPLVDDDGGPDAEASMSRGEVMEAARALCPEVGQQRDALRDLVLTLGWHAESVPGRVIVYEALRLTCGEAGLDADLIELRESLYEDPARHQSWRIRRYATLGAVVAAALQSVHVGEEQDEVHQLLQTSMAGAWPR